MRYAIILGAGKGTRMKSELPKVMHEVCQKPMIAHLVDNLKQAQAERVIAVVGYRAELVSAYLGTACEYAIQDEQLGTGHAVMQVTQLKDLAGQTIVVNGDCPLITPETFESMYQALKDHALVVLTAIVPDAKSYGRVLVDEDLNISEIVEYRDCTLQQASIKEINTGIYVFNNQDLFASLKHLDNNNNQAEYYITDLVKVLKQQGKSVKALRVLDYKEASGINDRIELAEANLWLQQKINQRHQLAGVTLIQPEAIFIAPEVEIGADTIIYPPTYLVGQTKIGRNCQITGSYIRDSKIGDNNEINQSRITDSELGEHNFVGPYAHIRTNSMIKNANRIGNFVELKKVQLANEIKCAHLTYLGDTTIEDAVNIGCGVVTVNYDGKNKYPTLIRKQAFIGSNVNLIAPIEVGEQAVVAAGSTITEYVPAGALAIARNHQTNKLDYGYKYFAKKKEQPE